MHTLAEFSRSRAVGTMKRSNRSRTSYRQLTQDEATDLEPTWSPDGASVAYMSDFAGNKDIWVISAAGMNRRRITRSPRIETLPAWSPDGSRLLYVSWNDTTACPEIWQIAVDTEVNSRLTPGSKPSWSPNGETFAFELWCVNGGFGKDNLAIFTLADSSIDEIEIDAAHVACGPVWSRTNWLVYTGMRDLPIGNVTDLWIVPLAGGVPEQLTDIRDADSPSWSPDGRNIVYSSAEHLWLYDFPSGTSIEVAGADTLHACSMPELSRDGTKIVYVSFRNGQYDLWVIESFDAGSMQ